MSQNSKNQAFKMPEEDPPFGLNHSVYPYQHRGRKELNRVRREARQADAEFLAHLAETRPGQLKRNGITDDEIAAMAEGDAPVGFAIRRVIPLTDKKGTNEFSNMVLIPKQPFGAKVGQYLHQQIDTVKPSRQRTIKLPLLKGPIFRIPKRSIEAVTETRLRLEAEHQAEADRRIQIREEKRIARKAKEEQRRAEKLQREEVQEEARQAKLRADALQDALKERAELLLELGALEQRGKYVQATDFQHLPELAALAGHEFPEILVPGDHDYHDGRSWDLDAIREAIKFESAYPTMERRRKGGKGRKKSQEPKNRIIYASGPASDNYGMPIAEIAYTRRVKTFKQVDGEKVDVLRYEGLLAKRKFLRKLVEEHGDEIKEAYQLTDCEVEGMRQGFSPEGLSVHHKHPLGGAGDPRVAARANDFDNFILIPNQPYHLAIHQHLDPQIERLKPNETAIVRVLMPEGSWFKPTMPYQRSGPPKCQDDPVIDPTTPPSNARQGRVDPGVSPG
ncbi:MAG: hypothetical protein KI792_11155 [Alphaproteobacteria bacterium]|nr:hypothetical protein [Alphaproteobacteria bacterium SS10]